MTQISELDQVEGELQAEYAAKLAAVAAALDAKWGRCDGVLHSVGFAPANCLGEDLFAATWEEVSMAMHVSTYSLRVLAEVVHRPRGVFLRD